MKKDQNEVWQDDPISLWFELSYAQYLTVPRSVMEAMPYEWQKKMAGLLFEMDARIDWRPKEGRYWCRLKDGKGRFVHDPFMEYRHPIKITVRTDEKATPTI